jgi:hypothetical protein
MQCCAGFRQLTSSVHNPPCPVPDTPPLAGTGLSGTRHSPVRYRTPPPCPVPVSGRTPDRGLDHPPCPVPVPDRLGGAVRYRTETAALYIPMRAEFVQ